MPPTIEYVTPVASGRAEVEDELTIGRSPDCGLVLDAPEVSRRHAVFTRSDGGLSFTDLGSANGSWLNGVRVAPNTPIEVTEGDTVRIGGCTLTVAADPAPPAVAAATPILVAAPGSAATVLDNAAVSPMDARTAVGAPVRATLTDPHAGRLSPATGLPLALVAGLAFLVFVGSHTVNAVILDPDYYLAALEDGDIFEKAFSSLLSDPSLGGEVADFFGGVDVKPGDRVPTAKRIAPPADLKSSVLQTAGKTTRFFDDKQDLDLGLNITSFLSRIDDGAADYTAERLLDLPTKRSANYSAFLTELRAFIEKVRTTGTLPETVPVFDIPSDRREEVRQVIISGAGVNESTPDGTFINLAVRAALASNDVESAIKAALVPMLNGVTSNATNSLIDSKYISKGPGGDVLLAPSLDALSGIDSGFSDFQMVVKISDTAEPISLAVLLVALVAMLGLGWPNVLRAARWVGLTLMSSGLVGIIGWFAGRGALKDYVAGIALEDPSGLPGSFRGLVEDGIGAAVDNLTSTIVTPCVVAVGVGLVVSAVAIILERRKAGARVASEAPSGPVAAA